MTILLSDIYPYLIALAISIARPLGLIYSSALFNWLSLGNLQKYSISAVISIVTFPIALQFVESAAFSLIYTSLIIAIEFVVGFAFGTAISIPIYGAQLAGDYIDQFRVSSVASDFDTSQSVESTVGGTWFTLVALSLFVAVGGFQAMFGGLYSTYAIWPIATPLPELTAEAATAFFKLLDLMFRIGLIVSAPVMIPLIIVDIGLMLSARAGQQFNLFELSLTLKNLAFIVLMMLMCGPIIYGVSTQIEYSIPLGHWVLEAML